MHIQHVLRHTLHARPRLIAATLTGVFCFTLMPSFLPLLTRSMVSWNVLAWTYIALLWWLMLRADTNRIRRVARLQDESATTVLVLVTIACLVSLVVIFLELATARSLFGIEKIWHLTMTAITLVAAWMLVPTAFAIHYAHLFYRTPSTDKPVMLFPDKTDTPHYWDFLYFSFTIAVASQTADVAVCTTAVRRVVLLQSILSFIFNISILGLSINVGASLLG